MSLFNNGFKMSKRAVSAVSASYMDSAVSAANSTGYTFSGLDFGAADAARHIVVAIASRTLGSGSDPTVTIGGVSATKRVGAWVAKHRTTTIHIYSANVPIGTSGDVVITGYGSTMLRCLLHLYRVINLSSVDAVSVSGLGVSASSDILPSSGDVVIASGASVNAVLSFTGITEDAEHVTEGLTHNAGSGPMPGSLTWIMTGYNEEWATAAIGIS